LKDMLRQDHLRQFVIDFGKWSLPKIAPEPRR
jgi:hypothetical protein